jgi:phosphatidyl-myo-inositol dimannoside synthase
MSERLKPRVLMLTSTLPRWEGDSEPRFVLDLARHLGDEFDIELLAPHAPGAARSESLEGVRVTRFRYWIPRWQSVAYEGGISWRLKENPLRLLQVPFFLFSLGWHILRRMGRAPRITLIHAHWIIPQGLVAVLARVLGRHEVPLVCTSHGGDLFGLRGSLWTAIKRWVLQRCDLVTVVSNAMAARVREIARDVKPAVIPMGTDLTGLFTPPVQPRRLPMKRLIFVGRLVEKKGVKYLLEAMSSVRMQHPDIRLSIIGHGPLRDSLETDVEKLGLREQVSFLGPVPHAQLPAHYQNADVAVFPFVESESGDQEGFGLVMVEAMGCECAVIASDLPAVRDALQNGKTGIAVPPRDVAALAHSIGFLITNPAVAQTLARQGRELAVSRFDWSIIREDHQREFAGQIGKPL